MMDANERYSAPRYAGSDSPAEVTKGEMHALAARLAEAVAAIEGLLNALPSATTHPAIIAARKVVAAQESDDAQR